MSDPPTLARRASERSSPPKRAARRWKRNPGSTSSRFIPHAAPLMRAASLMLKYAQLAHRQFVDLERAETRLLDYHAADRKAADRQRPDGERAERRRAQRQRQQ